MRRKRACKCENRIYSKTLLNQIINYRADCNAIRKKPMWPHMNPRIRIVAYVRKIVFLPVLAMVLVSIASTAKGIDIGTNNHALVLNTWNDFPLENKTDVSAMPAQALQAYWTLRDLGYRDENIVLMLYHSGEDFIDYDGDGLNDLTNATIDVENANINKTRVRHELEQIVREVNGTDDILVLYLIGHGILTYSGQSMLTFENGDSLSADDLNTWTKDIICKKIIYFLDFCYSGKFATSVRANGVFVSSADSEHEGWFYWDWANTLSETDKRIFGNSGSVFFHPFWKEVGKGNSLENAFLYAKAMCTHWADIDPMSANITRTQNPQMFETTPESQQKVSISKTSTAVSPSSLYVNDSATLSVVISNSGQNDTPIVLRVTGVGLDISPGENRSMIIPPGSTTIYYGVRSNTTGTFIIEIELWIQEHKVDTSTSTVKFSEPIQWRDLTSYETRVGIVYLIAGFTILSAYVRALSEQLGRPFWQNILMLGLLWGVFGGIALLSGALIDGLLLLLSPSLGRIETILAFSFIISISTWILIYYKKTSYSLFSSNINVFLISLPVVFDWLLSPILPFPDTIFGKIFWQIIATVLSVMFGVVLDRIIRGKIPSLKSILGRHHS